MVSTSAANTGSDDDVVEVQVPASHPIHDKVLEEHAQAVQEVQLQHLDDDSDMPGLISSSELSSSGDDDPPEETATRRKQVETRFEPPS